MSSPGPPILSTSVYRHLRRLHCCHIVCLRAMLQCMHETKITFLTSMRAFIFSKHLQLYLPWLISVSVGRQPSIIPVEKNSLVHSEVCPSSTFSFCSLSLILSFSTLRVYFPWFSAHWDLHCHSAPLHKFHWMLKSHVVSSTGTGLPIIQTFSHPIFQDFGPAAGSPQPQE